MNQFKQLIRDLSETLQHDDVLKGIPLHRFENCNMYLSEMHVAAAYNQRSKLWVQYYLKHLVLYKYFVFFNPSTVNFEGHSVASTETWQIDFNCPRNPTPIFALLSIPTSSTGMASYVLNLLTNTEGLSKASLNATNDAGKCVIECAFISGDMKLVHALLPYYDTKIKIKLMHLLSQQKDCFGSNLNLLSTLMDVNTMTLFLETCTPIEFCKLVVETDHSIRIRFVEHVVSLVTPSSCYYRHTLRQKIKNLFVNSLGTLTVAGVTCFVNLLMHAITSHNWPLAQAMLKLPNDILQLNEWSWNQINPHMPLNSNRQVPLTYVNVLWAIYDHARGQFLAYPENIQTVNILRSLWTNVIRRVDETVLNASFKKISLLAQIVRDVYADKQPKLLEYAYDLLDCIPHVNLFQRMGDEMTVRQWVASSKKSFKCPGNLATRLRQAEMKLVKSTKNLLKCVVKTTRFPLDIVHILSGYLLTKEPEINEAVTKTIGFKRTGKVKRVYKRKLKSKKSKSTKTQSTTQPTQAMQAMQAPQAGAPTTDNSDISTFESALDNAPSKKRKQKINDVKSLSKKPRLKKDGATNSCNSI